SAPQRFVYGRGAEGARAKYARHRPVTHRSGRRTARRRVPPVAQAPSARLRALSSRRRRTQNRSQLGVGQLVMEEPRIEPFGLLVDIERRELRRMQLL